eukprot:scaffold1913_cov257-Pinguiococcus_pyrenoidosus.AAC.22
MESVYGEELSGGAAERPDHDSGPAGHDSPSHHHGGEHGGAAGSSDVPAADDWLHVQECGVSHQPHQEPRRHRRAAGREGRGTGHPGQDLGRPQIASGMQLGSPQLGWAV